MNKKINHAVKVLREGGIIAYPTEGVFGFGCDPFNETAVLRLLKIKQRNIKHGLILIASSWDQVTYLIKLKNIAIKQNAKNPITWVCPATKKVPTWVSGRFDSIAIRVTLHQIAKKLCQRFGGPIISTSANVYCEDPAKNYKQVSKQFSHEIDFILSGQVGDLKKSTEIRDIKTNKLIRR